MDIIVKAKDNSNKLINENLIKLYSMVGIEHKTIGISNYFFLNAGVEGVHDALFNSIVLPEIKEVGDIEKINAPFLQQKLPFYWVIEDGTMSEEILSNFVNDNNYSSVKLPGMILDLNKYVPLESYKHSYEISVITDLTNFTQWVHVVAKCFGISQNGENMWLKKFSPFLEANDNFIPIGVFSDNTLIASASIVISDGIAGFYYDGTLEAYRNQGICTSLYDFRFKLLKDLGINKVVIQTTPDATSIAKKAGFEVVNEYQIFENDAAVIGSTEGLETIVASEVVNL